MKRHEAFDQYAGHYDHHFTESAIGRYQRAQVWTHLKPLIEVPRKILEVNCGTGTDAIRLAELGHEVLATDASAEMVGKSKEKAKQRAVGQVPGFLQADFLDLEDILKGRQFDLIFSNFGGLNCIDENATAEVAGIFNRLLNPGGCLFLVYMSSGCLWEKWYFRYQGDLVKANRRQSAGPVKAQIGQKTIDIWYYTPSQLHSIYSPFFRQQSSRPVGLLVPPSYLEGYFQKKRQLLRLFNLVDSTLNWPVMANLADHFAIIMQKKC